MGGIFSFLQNPENIALKIKSFSHGEFNIKELTDKKKIEMRVLNNQDILTEVINLKKLRSTKIFQKYILTIKVNFQSGSYKLARPEGFEPSTF